MTNPTSNEPQTGMAANEHPISFSSLELGAKMMFEFIEQAFKQERGHLVPGRDDLALGVGRTMGFNPLQARACMRLMDALYGERLQVVGYNSYSATGQRGIPPLADNVRF